MFPFLHIYHTLPPFIAIKLLSLPLSLVGCYFTRIDLGGDAFSNLMGDVSLDYLKKSKLKGCAPAARCSKPYDVLHSHHTFIV